MFTLFTILLVNIFKEYLYEETAREFVFAAIALDIVITLGVWFITSLLL